MCLIEFAKNKDGICSMMFESIKKDRNIANKLQNASKNQLEHKSEETIIHIKLKAIKRLSALGQEVPLNISKEL